MRREQFYLGDIVSAAEAIGEFLRGMDYDSFESSRMVRSAVVHELTVIGEAVARLSEELRTRHPDVPWADIKAFRNIMVHNYFGIDWEEVWRTATVRVPALRARIAAILRAEFSE